MSDKESEVIELISEEQVRAIVENCFGPQVQLLCSERMHGGHYNTLYEVKTENPAHHAVLRVAPRDERPEGRYERSPMLAEPLKYDLIRKAGIPTADVLAVDGSRSVVDRDCIVVDYIDAVPLNHESVPKEVRPQIMREAGRLTALMHGITAERFGWVQADGKISGSDSWADIFGEIMTETYTLAREAGVISASDAEAALACYWKHRSIFDECRVPALVHNDIWDPNILVNQIDDNWEIRAIIDVDGALFADPEFEFILWDSTDGDFLAGYGKPLDMSQNAVLKRKFYRMNLYMIYAWFYLVMQPSPGFQPSALKTSMDIFKELCG